MDIQAVATTAVNSLSTTMAIGGATAVPLFVMLENFIMGNIPNPSAADKGYQFWHGFRTALPAIFSLAGWFGVGLSQGMPGGSMLLGAATTTGGSWLIHEVLSILPDGLQGLASLGVKMALAPAHAPHVDPMFLRPALDKGEAWAKLYDLTTGDLLPVSK